LPKYLVFAHLKFEINLKSLQIRLCKDSPIFQFLILRTFRLTKSLHYRDSQSRVTRVWSDENGDLVLKAGDDYKNTDYAWIGIRFCGWTKLACYYHLSLLWR